LPVLVDDGGHAQALGADLQERVGEVRVGLTRGIASPLRITSRP
jgi:hypothetical protein